MRNSFGVRNMQAAAGRTRARGPVPLFLMLLLLVGVGPAWCGCLHALGADTPQGLEEVAEPSQCHGEDRGATVGEAPPESLSHCAECAGYASAADVAPVSKLPAQGADLPASVLAAALVPLSRYTRARSLPAFGRSPPTIQHATGVTLHTLMLD